MSTAASYVLVVDDSEPILIVLRSAVEAAGMVAVLATSAAEAEACKDQLGCANLSLAVLDVYLQADGPTGYELYQSWAARCPELPVLLISGHPHAEDLPAVASGRVPLVKKPFDFYELVTLFHDLAHRRDAEHGAG